MFIFQGTFAGKSKKNDKPFWQINLFEKREAQDKTVYFKAISVFVEEPIYQKINKFGYKFGDVVEVIKGAPQYFGGAETLVDLKLVAESPYFEK